MPLVETDGGRGGRYWPSRVVVSNDLLLIFYPRTEESFKKFLIERPLWERYCMRAETRGEKVAQNGLLVI